MKKLLGIVVLGLLLSSNANSKIIVLKKCSLGDAYEKWNYKIDTSKSRITEVRVYSEKYLKNLKEQMKSQPKITVVEFKMTYFDPPYAKGERNFVGEGENRKSEIDINLDNKKILNTFTYGDGSKFSYDIKCS